MLILNSNFLFFLSISKLETFLMLPVSSLNTILFTIKLSRAKKKLEKFSFNELKIKKVKLFTQSPIPKFFALINVFNVGGFLASCLTFRPFLMLDTCIKKTCILIMTKKHKRQCRMVRSLSSNKMVKSNVPSVNFCVNPYFVNVFKFFVVKLKFL